MSIHIRVRQLLLRENVSVAAFERKIGVGKRTISYILNNESSISHEILEKIRNNYPDYSLCWLVAGVTEKETLLNYIGELKGHVFAAFSDFEQKIKK